jgi:hypothetical protein
MTQAVNQSSDLSGTFGPLSIIIIMLLDTLQRLSKKRHRMTARCR